MYINTSTSGIFYNYVVSGLLPELFHVYMPDTLLRHIALYTMI